MLKITKLQPNNNEVNIQIAQAIKGGSSLFDSPSYSSLNTFDELNQLSQFSTVGRSSTLGTPNPISPPIVPSLTSYSYELKRDLNGYSVFS